jgi:hypothetical protein
MKKKTKKKKIRKGGQLTSSEIDLYKSLTKKDPKLKFLLDEFINNDISNSNTNNNTNASQNQNEEDSIKIMFQSIRQYNNKPNMNCNDIVKFLKRYEESKKLFNNITITELDNIILATNHVCQTNPGFH